MSIKKYTIAVLIVFLAITASVQADWEDRFGQAKVVYLSDIVNDPDSWLEVVVRIPLRFQGIRNVYTPFFSHFDREHDLNFAGWDVHTPIWERDGFTKEFPFFYVSKDNPELKTFLKLRKFETISVLGKVAAIFKGRPYIKIVYVCKMPGDLNIHNLTLLNRGMRAFSERRFEHALGTFQKIFLTNPPDDIKAMLHKLSAKIYLYEKKAYPRALFQLEKGLAITKNDPEMQEMHTQCRYFMQHGGPPPRPIQVKLEKPEPKVEQSPQQEEPAVETGTTPAETTEVPNVYEENGPIELEDTLDQERTENQESTEGDYEEEVIEYWDDEG